MGFLSDDKRRWAQMQRLADKHRVSLDILERHEAQERDKYEIKRLYTLAERGFFDG